MPTLEPTKTTLAKRQKFELDWARTRLGHEGMMLEKIQRQNRIVEQLAAQTRDGKFTGGPVPSVPEDEDMGVSIGNETHNHYAATPKSLGSLGKLIVAASLLAGGAGAGLLATQLLPSDPPPVPPATVDTDTVTDVTFPEEVPRE